MIRAVAIVAMLSPFAANAQSVAEPEDYRNDAYRGPVPVTVQGGTVVETDAAYALWKTGKVVFLDVLPQAPKPDNLPEGTIWRDKPRHSIPGSIWLPNVGYGQLAKATDDYFRQGLSRSTAGDIDTPVLFFCLSECWMSWNAAKRAVEYGYTHVFWYPDGTDGWTFDDYPTELITPEP